MEKTWIVDGEYYHKKKTKFKGILGGSGYQYDWKGQPNYIWRRDGKRFVEADFDRNERADGSVERNGAKITYHGPENIELFELISEWAKGHEVKWRKGLVEDPLMVVKKHWRAVFRSKRAGRAPKVWVRMMTKEFREKLQRLKVDLETENEIRIEDYMYSGV